MKHWKKHSAIIIVLALGIFLRLYNIDDPLWDRHHFRQTDTYAVILNLFEGRSDIFHPKFFQTPNPENTQGLYFGEFPLYQGFIALLFHITGESIPIARLVSIALTAVTTLGIYGIMTQLTEKRIGVVAAIAFTLFPASLFWGRSISPDVMALMFYVISWWMLLTRQGKMWFWLASAAWACAVLIKPYYLAFGISYAYFFAHYWLCLENQHYISWKKWFGVIIRFSMLPVILYTAWRLWALSFPAFTIDPDPAYILHARQGWWTYWHKSDWLSVLVSRHLFGELITPLGGLLVVLGITQLFAYGHAHRRLLMSWLVVPLLISSLFAWGSWQHDYYLLPWMLGLSASVSVAVIILWDNIAQLWHKNIPQFEYLWKGGLLLFLVFFSYFWGIKKMADYHLGFFQPQGYILSTPSYNYDYEQMKTLIPREATVITLLKERDPFPLTAIRRTGNIMKVSADEPCRVWHDILAEINSLRLIKASYLLVHKNTSQGDICPREFITELVVERNERIYQGSQFDLYVLRQPTLMVRGSRDVIELYAEYLGDEPVLEVGGIPGTETAIKVTPEWQDAGEFARVATISASEWLSFYTFWQSPQIILATEEWYLDDYNWVVKK